MQYFYSSSTNGFYVDAVHGKNMPEDAIAISEALWKDCAGQSVRPSSIGMPEVVPAAPLTLEQVVTVLTGALQSEMDAQARARGYDDIKTAITYRGDPNPKFATEAEAFFEWRSAVWTQAYALLAQVQAGQAQFPSIDDAVAMMPALVIDAPP